MKRAERRSIPVEDVYFLDRKDNSSPLEDQVLENEVKQQLYHYCIQLKSPYKEVAVEHFYHGLTASDIAAKTGKNIKTVQTQIYRSKALLKKQYEKEAGII